MEDEAFVIKKLMLIKKIYSKYFCEKGSNKLTSAFAVFVEALSEREFSSQQELSQHLGCNKAHTSRTLLKMQLMGLIKPVCKNITLTEKGKQYAQMVKQKQRKMKQELLCGISESELKVFKSVLDKILNNGKVFENS